MQVKPPRPVVQWGHPLARGLVHAWALWERGGTAPACLVSRAPLEMIGGVAASDWTVRHGGPGVLTGSAALSTRGLRRAQPHRFDHAGRNPVTMAAWVWYDKSQPASNVYGAGVVQLTDNATVDGTLLFLYEPGGNTAWGTQRNAVGGPSTLLGSTSGYQTGLYHAVMTYDGNYQRLYINAKLDGELADTLSIGSSAACAIGVGVRTGPTTIVTDSRFPGVVLDARFWNRALSASEVGQLYADPWGMYWRQRPVRCRTATAATATGRWYYDLTSRRRRA